MIRSILSYLKKIHHSKHDRIFPNLPPHRSRYSRLTTELRFAFDDSSRAGNLQIHPHSHPVLARFPANFRSRASPSIHPHSTRREKKIIARACLPLALHPSRCTRRANKFHGFEIRVRTPGLVIFFSFFLSFLFFFSRDTHRDPSETLGRNTPSDGERGREVDMCNAKIRSYKGGKCRRRRKEGGKTKRVSKRVVLPGWQSVAGS